MDCSVVVATSYIECHPCMKMLDRAIGSLKRIGLQDAYRIICCDHETEKGYEEYVKQAGDRCDLLIRHDEKCGLGYNVASGVMRVSTEFVFVLQHDFEIIKEIPLREFEAAFTSDLVKMIRLHRLPNVIDIWDTILKPVNVNGTLLLKASGWSDNPHFARMSYYKDVVIPKLIKTDTGEGLETGVHTSYQKRIFEVGFEKAHSEYGVYIYGKIGDGPTLSHFGGKRIRSIRHHTKPECC